MALGRLRPHGGFTARPHHRLLLHRQGEGRTRVHTHTHTLHCRLVAGRTCSDVSTVTPPAVSADVTVCV